MAQSFTTKKSSNFDWIAFALFSSLVVIGWLMIYASTYDIHDSPGLFDFDSIIGKQTFWVILSYFLLLLTQVVDARFWKIFAYQIDILFIVFLILVLFIGHSVKGATSWFSFGGFSIQPSEFAKFGTCLALCSFLSFYRTNLSKIKYQLVSLFIIGLPVCLILLQPDAGSALIFLSFFIVLFRAGMPPLLYFITLALIILFILSFIIGPQYVLLLVLWLATGGLFLVVGASAIVVALCIIAMIVLTYFVSASGFYTELLALSSLLFIFSLALVILKKQNPSYILIMGIVLLASAFSFGTNYAFDHMLQPHQQDRINVWLKPEKCDPKGALYNILQSKMAIGSGGLQGKGFLKGTMSKLNYVPEQSTDFIFTVVGEEQGFIGSLSIIVLFTLLIVRIIHLGERSEQPFNLYYAYGLAGLLFTHCAINIGMTVGLFPVIGIPLPFISYGGSSLLGFTLLTGVFLKLIQKN